MVATHHQIEGFKSFHSLHAFQNGEFSIVEVTPAKEILYMKTGSQG